MQFTKDTFFLALRDRLAALAPTHTVVVDGLARPAVLVAENEPTTSAPPLPRAFYLRFGACEVVASAAASHAPLRRLECEVSYHTSPDAGDSYARGRSLGALDAELLRLCDPPQAAKCDGTRTPPVPLGSTISWSQPQFAAPEDDGSQLVRRARLSLFFYAEPE